MGDEAPIIPCGPGVTQGAPVAAWMLLRQPIGSAARYKYRWNLVAEAADVHSSWNAVESNSAIT